MEHGTKPLIIIVTGAASASHKAERGTINIRVASETESQSEVARNVTSASNQLQELFKTTTRLDSNGHTAEDSPITKWSMGSLSTSSYEPWSDEKPPPPRKYTASVSLEATFRDFKVLGSVANDLLEQPFVTVESITWDLTNATKAELGVTIREGAFRDAATKAKDFARAAGCSRTYPIEISDAIRSSENQPLRLAAMRRSGGDGGEALNLTPENVDIETSVTVKFEATR